MNNSLIGKEFWNTLFEEFKLTKEMTLLISKYSSLLENSTVTVNSIKVREQIVLPLLVIQPYAMQKIKENVR